MRTTARFFFLVLLYAFQARTQAQTASLYTNVFHEEGTHFTLKQDQKCTIFPMGEEGVFYYYNIPDDDNPARKNYAFVMMDNMLEEYSIRKYKAPEWASILAATENEGYFYFIVAVQESSHIIKGALLKQYTILKYDPVERNIDTFAGVFPGRGSYFKRFEVVNDIAYLNTLDLKNKSGIVVHNLRTDSVQMVPVPAGFLKGKKRNIAAYIINDSTNEGMVLYESLKGKKVQSVLQQFDTTGKEVSHTGIVLPQGRKFENASIAEVNGKKVVYGEYGTTQKMTAGRNRGRSLGCFFAVVNDTAKNAAQLLPYGMQKGIPLSLDEERRLKFSGAKDKEVRMDRGIVFAKPMSFRDQIILTGEVYYATYRTESHSRTYVDAGGHTRYSTTQQEVFDGWVFSNILVVVFDTAGHLLWNNSGMYSLPKTEEINSHISPEVLDNGFVRVVYNNKSVMMNMIIGPHNVVSDAGAQSLNGDEEISAASGTELRHWFEEYYLAITIETIEEAGIKMGKEKKNPPKEKVYHFSKVVLK